eukprot:gb/GECG01007571.1/.p1 GENE.gb/GECG01007571.1/~~gb/GECG01007571.1/.p1  ORF type:complete len:657 (+),score=48.91 gb/GECG01007571.1/:1-1971(+)
MANTTTNYFDYILISAYVLALASLTYYHARRMKNHDTTSYFLAKRDTKWFAVGSSFFASNIGSDSIIGLSSAGASVGIAASFFDMASPYMFLLLAYVFLPIFMRQFVFTMPEYTERRFGKKMRIYLAAMSLLIYIVSRVSASLFCGAIIMESTLGLGMWTSVAILLLFTGVFTMIGGLAAIIHVEVINTILLVVGGSLTTALVMHEVGGWSGLSDKLHDSPEATAAGMDESYLKMYQTSGPYSWSAILFGAPWLMLWFHCTEQEMVQRGLAAKSTTHGASGSIMAGFLKLTIPFAWCLPGIAARYLYPEDMDCPQNDDGECPGANKAFPVVMSHLMPNGVLGLMIAAMLAAILSVLASTFNSASTIFAMDVFKRLKPAATDKALVRAGRIWVATMTALGVLWIPILSHLDDSLYVAMQSVNAMIGPPIAIVFLIAVLWPRATEAGALTGLISGHLFGGIRLLWMAGLSAAGSTASSGFGKVFVGSSFLHFGAVLVLLSGLVMVTVSLFTELKDPVENAANTVKFCLRTAGKVESFYLEEFKQAYRLVGKREKVQRLVESGAYEECQNSGDLAPTDDATGSTNEAATLLSEDGNGHSYEKEKNNDEDGDYINLLKKNGDARRKYEEYLKHDRRHRLTNAGLSIFLIGVTTGIITWVW